MKMFLVLELFSIESRIKTVLPGKIVSFRQLKGLIIPVHFWIPKINSKEDFANETD